MLCLLSLLCLGVGPPVLSGSEPGALRLYPKQLAALAAARQSPPLSAAAALLADSDTGRTLLALEADQRRPMASTTKMMTALLARERVDLEEVVVVAPSALVGQAAMGLAAGETLTAEDLLWGLLLNSGNDAAVALAEYVAGDEPQFVALMNGRASELGLVNTHFANAHGMDAPGHYSSAFDLWRLAETALDDPLLRRMVATRSHVAAGHPLWNRNELLGLYPGADGVKTGTTDLAGECLVASVTRNGHRVIVVVLGSQSRYADAQALFDHYFAAYRWGSAPAPAGRSAWVRGAEGQPWRVIAPQVPDLFLADWQWPLLRTQVVIEELPADLSQPAGFVQWRLGAELLGQAFAFLSPY